MEPCGHNPLASKTDPNDNEIALNETTPWRENLIALKQDFKGPTNNFHVKNQ